MIKSKYLPSHLYQCCDFISLFEMINAFHRLLHRKLNVASITPSYIEIIPFPATEGNPKASSKDLNKLAIGSSLGGSFWLPSRSPFLSFAQIVERIRDSSYIKMSENKANWRTYLLVGGALLSCGLGVFAMRRLTQVPDRQAGPSAPTTPPAQITEKPQNPREGHKNRHEAVRSRSAYSTWTQTFEEVVIEIPVPPDVKSKDVKCTFNTKSISVNIKSNELLKGDLFQDITPDECSWEIDGDGTARTLTISLIKGAFHLGHWNQILKDGSSDSPVLTM